MTWASSASYRKTVPIGTRPNTYFFFWANFSVSFCSLLIVSSEASTSPRSALTCKSADISNLELPRRNEQNGVTVQLTRCQRRARPSSDPYPPSTSSESPACVPRPPGDGPLRLYWHARVSTGPLLSHRPARHLLYRNAVLGTNSDNTRPKLLGRVRSTIVWLDQGHMYVSTDEISVNW